MAERKFDYQEIANVYKEMQKITGSSSDANSIAGILYKIDQDVHNSVAVENESIYGDLGSQLLLDWENTSSNFPNFVSNFENWAALIAQSAGNYAQFEQDVQGFRNSNPLGATSKGITDAYVNTGYYSNAISSEKLDEFAQLAQFYQLTGADYIDTGMTSYLTRQDIFEGIELVLDCVVIGSSVKTIANYVSAVNTLNTTGTSTAALKSLGASGRDIGLYRAGLTNAGKGAVRTVENTITSNSLLSRFYSTGIGSKLFPAVRSAANSIGRTGKFISTLGQSGSVGRIVLQAAKSTSMVSNIATGVGLITASVLTLSQNGGTPTFNPNTVVGLSGSTVNINGSSYTYLGQSATGSNLYFDSSDHLVCEDASGNIIPVTLSNGSAVTMDDFNKDGSDQLYANGTSLGNINGLYYFAEEDRPVEYTDAVNQNMAYMAEN